MDLQEFWNRFIHTGEPAAYLLYRGLHDEHDKERYGASHAQRSGHPGDRFRG